MLQFRLDELGRMDELHIAGRRIGISPQFTKTQVELAEVHICLESLILFACLLSQDPVSRSGFINAPAGCSLDRAVDCIHLTLHACVLLCAMRKERRPTQALGPAFQLRFLLRCLLSLLLCLSVLFGFLSLLQGRLRNWGCIAFVWRFAWGLWKIVIIVA